MRARGYRSRFARVENPLPSLRSIAPQDWPPDDRRLFALARSSEDPLTDPGKAAEWRPSTIANRARAYGRFLWLLQERGDLDPAETLAERVTRARVTALLDHLKATVSPITVRQALLDLSFVLYVMDPARDWSWVRRLPGLPTEREANASRREKPVVVPEAIIAPAQARLEELARHPATLEVAAEMMHHTLVIIGFYLKCRCRNLTGLKLGETIMVAADHVAVCVPGNDTKTGMAIDTRLARGAEAALRLYLSEARGVLLGKERDEGWLWLNRAGHVVSDRQAWMIFSRLGHRYLGHHISPHTTRRTYATAMQKAHPGMPRTSAAGLSHKGLTTFLGSYDKSGDALAQSRWARIVSKRARGG